MVPYCKKVPFGLPSNSQNLDKRGNTHYVVKIDCWYSIFTPANQLLRICNCPQIALVSQFCARLCGCVWVCERRLSHSAAALELFISGEASVLTLIIYALFIPKECPVHGVTGLYLMIVVRASSDLRDPSLELAWLYENNTIIEFKNATLIYQIK